MFDFKVYYKVIILFLDNLSYLEIALLSVSVGPVRWVRFGGSGSVGPVRWVRFGGSGSVGLVWYFDGVGSGMAKARNGERFLTEMANAYGRNGKSEIIVC